MTNPTSLSNLFSLTRMGFLPLFFLTSLSFVVFLTFLKRRKDLNMKMCTIEKSLRGKIVLITGSSAGLGRELTYELAKRGAEVVMGCRNLQKADEALIWINQKLQKTAQEMADKKIGDGDSSVLPAKLHVLQLDLASMKSVEKFAANFTSRFKNLHILVNNAGQMGGQFSTTAGGVEQQFGVNHLGHFYLTNLLLDTLKASTPSRIVIISSGYYRKAESDFSTVSKSLGYQPLAAYARSKLANCLHGFRLAEILKDTKVGVYIVRPGFVRGTELGRNFSQLHTSLLFPILWFFSKNLTQGVQTMLYCCLADEGQLKSGALYNNCEEDEYDRDLVNEENARELWKLSEELVEKAVETEKEVK